MKKCAEEEVAVVEAVERAEGFFLEDRRADCGGRGEDAVASECSVEFRQSQQ